MSLSPTVLASLALLGFWLIEFLLRREQSARSWHTNPVDRGSTLAIICAYVLVALCLALNVGGPQFSQYARWVGVLVAFAGIALRVTAFRTLGSSYSRTLRVADHQALITHGIYRFIRHPGYASSILIWCGAAAGSGSMLVFVFVSLILIGVYLYRIRAEEAMLSQVFGTQYRQYQVGSWRLIPYVY